MKALKYVVMAVLLVCAFAMAGCGGDKFVGTWYAEGSNSIKRLEIEKDNTNYLVKYECFMYGRDFLRGLHGSYDLIYAPYSFQVMNMIGREKEGGHLYIDPFNDYVYVEKDKSLRHGNEIYYKGDETLKKIQDNIKARLSKEGEEYKREAANNPFMRKVQKVQVIDQLPKPKKTTSQAKPSAQTQTQSTEPVVLERRIIGTRKVGLTKPRIQTIEERKVEVTLLNGQKRVEIQYYDAETEGRILNYDPNEKNEPLQLIKNQGKDVSDFRSH